MLIARRLPSPSPYAQSTQTTTLTGSSLPDKDAIVESTACSGSPCSMTSDSNLKVGYDGNNHWYSALYPDLSSIPAGSRITSARLSLFAGVCLSTCSTQVIEA